MRLRAFWLLALACAGPGWVEAARADGHGITVTNGTAETIRSIQIAPVPGGGENRLRSQLPPGASGRIAYNTGCTASIRLGFEGGRTEDHVNVDVCSDPTVVAGREGVAGPAGAPIPASTPNNPAPARTGGKTVAAAIPLAPAPVVPPWTGRSITKRFGGME